MVWTIVHTLANKTKNYMVFGTVTDLVFYDVTTT